MEPLGIVARALDAVIFLRGVNDAFHGIDNTRPLGPEIWKRRKKTKHTALGWDLPLLDDSTRPVNARHGWETHVDPKNVPVQGGGTIRLTIQEQQAEIEPGRIRVGFTGLTEQWRPFDGGEERDLWHRIELFESSMPAVGRPSARVGEGERLGEYPPMQAVRYVRMLGDDDRRPQVEIKCRTFVLPSTADGPKGVSAFIPGVRFIAELQSLDIRYRGLRTAANWKMVLMLEIHHAYLRLFADFLTTLRPESFSDAQDQNGHVDPRRDQLRLWNLNRITEDAYSYARLAGMGTELANTAQSLLAVVYASVPTPAPDTTTIAFKELDAEVRGSCEEVRARLQKFTVDLESKLRFLELARNLQQTSGVDRLSLLATIFLPLSVATGVLSMQTRFRNLGVLLYDFFGVVVLLGAVVVVLLAVLSVIELARDRESRFVGNETYRRGIRPLLGVLLTVGALVYAGLVLSSFVVGMFKDVGLGARVLGYGTAGVVGLPVLALVGGCAAVVLGPGFAVFGLWGFVASLRRKGTG